MFEINKIKIHSGQISDLKNQEIESAKEEKPFESTLKKDKVKIQSSSTFTLKMK